MTKRHTTHFDDCGCLTHRYRIAINALEAIRRHMEIVMGESGVRMSPVRYLASAALEDISAALKKRETL